MLHRSFQAKPHGYCLFTVVTSATLASFCSTPANAQAQAESPRTALEEVIVTAQKRSERLQDVPVAVTAFGAERIEELDLRTTQDLVRRTPNLSVFAANRNTTYYVMRGLPVVFGEPNVGVFIDGVYQGSRAGLDSELVNVERVEVLRGPQNTLYGRNAFAGAISIITRKPNDEFTGRIEASLAQFGQQDLDGSISGPLVEGKLFGGASISSRTRDGFFTNQLTGNELDERDAKSATLVLRATPTEQWDITLKASGEKVRDGDYAYELFRSNALPNAAGMNSAFVGEGPYPDTFPVTPGHFDRDFARANLTAQWSGDRFTLTSISGVNDVEADSLRDSDYQAQRFQSSLNHNEVREYAQELRLASADATAPLSWLIAASGYRSEESVDNSTLFLDQNPTTIALAPGSQSLLVSRVRNELEIKSYSIFGQVGYQLLDGLRLTGGLRYDTDEKQFSQSSQTLAGTTTYPGPLDPDTATYRLWSWKAAVDYHLAPDTLLFASAALGQRAGGFNADGQLTPEERLYGPEKIYTYELGVKSEWLDRRLRTNATVFYTRWRDQQNSTGFIRNNVLLQPIVNTPEGSVPTSQGLELELELRVADGLDLSLGYGYTDSTYDTFDFTAVARAVGLPASAGILDGNRQVLTPEHTLSFAANYERPLMEQWTLFMGTDVAYESSKYASQFNLDAVGPYTVVNANVGLANGRWRFTLFARNLLDDEYTVARALARNYALTGSPTESGFAPGDPRQFGARVAVSF